MSEKLCLQWNDFKDNIISSFGNLRKENDFADVTLVSEDGHQVESHKVVLSSSSPVFQKMLKGNKHNHPLIYMRGLKSENLFAILDFLYCGEASVYQENLDSFLAIAEELQLKGLVGNIHHEEAFNGEQPENKVPFYSEPIFKKEQCVSKSVVIPETSELLSGNFANDAYVVAKPNDISGDIEKLDEQVNSMMEKTARKNVHGLPLYACKVCGKETQRSHMVTHIEGNHLVGVSLPCNFCEMTFRSRKAKEHHMRTYHKRSGSS